MMDRNLDPRHITKECIAARYLWGDTYASQSGGQVDFYERLDQSRKRICRDLVDDIERCERRDGQRR